MVTKTGPLSSVHHSWTKTTKPETATPCSHVIPYFIKILNLNYFSTLIIYIADYHGAYTIDDGPEVNAGADDPSSSFMFYDHCEDSWLCSPNKAHPRRQW